MEATICPGCGVQLEAIEGLSADPAVNASPECRQLDTDVTGFELGQAWLATRCHQMTVDAYGAQHAGDPTRPIRLAYSLVGLHLALDLGLSGAQVRAAHSRMGRPDASWPPFARPAGKAAKSIADVAHAGVQAGSAEGHATAVLAWARAVWAWWEPAHADVEAMARRLLGDWLLSR